MKFGVLKDIKIGESRKVKYCNTLIIREGKNERVLSAQGW